MPLVRIDVPASRDAAYGRKVSDAVHRALVDSIGIPPADRFHVVAFHEPDALIYDASFLDVQRSPDFIVVHVTLRAGRLPDKKRALYAAIAANVHEATGTRIEDVMIVLTENQAVDWSFGGGIAQYSTGD
jgi:phenylpyruvate tautomerase PptA (4-oxalocrotonate tautomerase family)